MMLSTSSTLGLSISVIGRSPISGNTSRSSVRNTSPAWITDQPERGRSTQCLESRGDHLPSRPPRPALNFSPDHPLLSRSEERRVGKGYVSPCRYRGSPEH